MSIHKIGVVGCGLMGSGIAQVCAQAGHPTLVREINDEALKKGLDRIRGFLAAGVQKGKLTQAQMDQTLANLQGTTALADLKDCDLVIEAVVENLDEKRKVFSELDKACKPSTIFASNTSSISITAQASSTKRMDRFIGLHFMNPVPIMKLVEIVRPEVTSAETYAAAKAFAEKLGKVTVTAKDTPGFIVNLLLVPYICEAVRALEHGLATKEDIDTAMELGCNMPMGPIKLLDFVGLDTTLFIMDVLFSEFRDPKYAAPPLLRRMVTAGYTGKKAGRGFYEYSKS
ncbi:MAG: 3-hydroxybutyryl-CoA dehydrogenase [Planctomycetota bacterium]|nr:MAG: 3-hydroxybutyryl-CoA dehydrogenase [Planctomycetota bacterium]